MAELEEVATEGVVQVVEGLVKVKSAYAALGVACGAAVGGLIAWRVAYSRARTQYAEVAEQEIATMRDHYQKKLMVAEGKPEVEKLAADLGYTSQGGDHETPAQAIAEDGAGEEEVLEPSEAEAEGKLIGNAFDNARYQQDAFEWVYEEEVARRDPTKPYVIHVDERDDGEGFDEVTFTYYQADDVLCDMRDQVINDRDDFVGDANLDRFGHGSGDATIVYIRNPRKGLDIEVVRSDKTYSEEVLGLTHSEPTRRRGRPRFDDE